MVKPTLLALLLSACSRDELPAGPAPLDPIAFFTGPSQGTGLLDPIVGRSSSVRVESRGLREGNALRLVQRITEGTKPPRTRTWVMQPLGNGRFTGTLTDAKGPVEINVVGPLALIDYATPGGMKIHQELVLQADGRTILNRLDASKYGLRLATLHETIRKPLAK